MIVADASWVISLRDADDRHHPAAVAVNEALGTEQVLLNPVTLAECLVAPAKLAVLDDAVVALRSAFEIIDIDDGAPVRWASLRATTGLRLPDVVVLDTAVHHGARAVATFDDRLATHARASGLTVLRAT